MPRFFEVNNCYFDLDSIVRIEGMLSKDDLQVYLTGVSAPINFGKVDARVMRKFFREHLPLFATLFGSKAHVVIHDASTGVGPEPNFAAPEDAATA